jgi:hypothetical protein
VRKGRLSLPRFADILPPSAIIYATPEDQRWASSLIRWMLFTAAELLPEKW